MLLFYLLAGFTFADAANYYIEISLNQCKLLLYAKDPDGSKILVQEYDVATVKKNKRIFPFGLGKITKIEIDPWWYPTNDSRKEFAKRGISLGSSISPGDPLNYMGKFKIYLSHETSKGSVYRIHGTPQSEDHKIGQRVTSGCIRMHNDEGLELARILTPGTEVNITN